MQKKRSNRSKRKKRISSLRVKGKRGQSPNLGNQISDNGPMNENFKNNLTAFIKNTCEIGIVNIVKEFHELQAYEKKNIKSHKAFDLNSNKCRYKDIFCYDDSRVILECKSNFYGENDFIHANYMSSNKTTFTSVCTQGPLPNTVYDFWRMVWQLKIRSIVMLCEVFEDGKKKCEQYWPVNSNENLKINDISIVFLGKHFAYRNIIKTYLRIIMNGKERIVFHYQYLEWPDRGVPTNHFLCLNLMRLAIKTRPIVIHCSAGIGRTGTVVCLDDMMFKLSTSEKCLRLKDVILKKRELRYGLVQTDIQYLFIHRVLISLALNKKLVSEEEVAQFIQQYEIILSKITDPLPNKKIENGEEVNKKPNIKQLNLINGKGEGLDKLDSDMLTKTQTSLEITSKPIEKTQVDEFIGRKNFNKSYSKQKKKNKKIKGFRTDTNSEMTAASVSDTK
uniref:Tyrosine-protein phosphatase domain-containing protein n=1 Tax=Strongyloides stercoralis TaxID=6248 RepID=A0A0K0E7X8_STRER